MMNSIATIGYEGATPESFDAALKVAGVELVIDVRAVAVSRKRGFSKTALAARLSEQGIRYVHLRGLGDPKPGREAARAGKMDVFRRIYEAQLRMPEAVEQLGQLTEIARAQQVALLCYEANAIDCHRAIIANHVARFANVRIVHLRASGETTARGARTYNHFGEGLASA